MENKEQYLYFPDCKIVRANLVPSITMHENVVSMYIKSLKNTPKHYPEHPLLNGKAEFYYGLETYEDYHNTFSTKYYLFFDVFVKEPVSKLVSKKVSLIAKFSPEAQKKLDTIGIGEPYGKMILYNRHISEEQIQQITMVAKLNYDLPAKEKKIITKKKL